jgi:hypothetical protein
MSGAGRGGARGISHWSTPTRLRAAAGLLVVLAGATLAVVVVGLTQVRDSVHTIGDHAAPVTSTASDLYFSLSDLDAQVARLILVGDDEAMTSTQFDGTRTFQTRVANADADIEGIAASATDATTRDQLTQLLDGLTNYEQLAGQATLLDDQTLGSVVGPPPGAALSFFFQATDLMHSQLLPIAAQVRSTYVNTLNSTYQSRHTTAIVGAVLTIVFGVALIVVLVGCQLWFSRRFRRRLNVPLVGALVLAIGLTTAVATVLFDEADQLHTAVAGSFQPYLTLLDARATSVDANADTVRYLLEPSLTYESQFTTASTRLTSANGPLRQAANSEVAVRWNANVHDNQQVVSLAGADRGGAVDAATGIARGKAGFDFYYYDTALSGLVTSEQQRFTAEIGSADNELSGWTFIPELVIAALLVLVYLAVRPRSAEYR